ncbi:MAG: hypothetical protein ABEJ59_06825 [Halanaeroarchaeum sp.]
MIGVVGADVDRMVDRLDGATAIDPADAAGRDLVVAVGEHALCSLASEAPTVPVLPVGIDGPIPAVDGAEVAAAVAAFRADETTTVEHPLLSVDVDGAAPRYALMDAMAVTTEPAKISEFAVATERDGERRLVDRVRADGVVVATPAGTPGYAAAAGGPVLDPGLSAVAVVPVGPFRVEHTHWVLELPATVTVAREESPVSLLVDDEEVGSIPAHEALRLTWGPTMSLVATDGSGPD